MYSALLVHLGKMSKIASYGRVSIKKNVCFYFLKHYMALFSMNWNVKYEHVKYSSYRWHILC